METRLGLEHGVEESIRRESLLAGGEHVLVALSGGPDSVALLRVLLALRGELDLQLGAAHLNHVLRGTPAHEDQDFVSELCRQLDVPLSCRKLDAGSLAGPGNLEDKLRRLRYAFLLEEAARERAVLATGHTLDDQVETFLLRSARGAGLRGLGGIRPRRRQRGVNIVRPLLDCTRTQVLEYLQELNQGYRLDETNLDAKLDRNWVRLQLLPGLERRLNPKVRETLGRTMRLLREVEDDLSRRARAALRKLVIQDGEGLRIPVDGLSDAGPALRRQMVREALRQVRGHWRGLAMGHVESVLALLERPSGRACSLPGCRVRREFDHLCFTRGGKVPDFSYELSIPGRIFVQEIRRSVRAEWAAKLEPTATGLVLRSRSASMIVRNRRPGDWIELDGRRRKLKRLFQERRVPLAQRNRMLIFEQDGRLAALEGLGVADSFRPREGSQDLVAIQVER